MSLFSDGQRPRPCRYRTRTGRGCCLRQKCVVAPGKSVGGSWIWIWKFKRQNCLFGFEEHKGGKYRLIIVMNGHGADKKKRSPGHTRATHSAVQDKIKLSQHLVRRGGLTVDSNGLADGLPTRHFSSCHDASRCLIASLDSLAPAVRLATAGSLLHMHHHAAPAPAACTSLVHTLPHSTHHMPVIQGPIFSEAGPANPTLPLQTITRYH